MTHLKTLCWRAVASSTLYDRGGKGPLLFPAIYFSLFCPLLCRDSTNRIGPNGGLSHLPLLLRLLCPPFLRLGSPSCRGRMCLCLGEADAKRTGRFLRGGGGGVAVICEKGRQRDLRKMYEKKKKTLFVCVYFLPAFFFFVVQEQSMYPILFSI